MIWKMMEESGLSPDSFAYNAFIDALLQKGLIEMEKKFDQEMFSKGLSPKPRKELETKYTSGLSKDEYINNSGNGIS